MKKRGVKFSMSLRCIITLVRIFTYHSDRYKGEMSNTVVGLSILFPFLISFCLSAITMATGHVLLRMYYFPPGSGCLSSMKTSTPVPTLAVDAAVKQNGGEMLFSTV